MQPIKINIKKVHFSVNFPSRMLKWVILKSPEIKSPGTLSGDVIGGLYTNPGPGVLTWDVIQGPQHYSVIFDKSGA